MVKREIDIAGGRQTVKKPMRQIIGDNLHLPTDAFSFGRRPDLCQLSRVVLRALHLEDQSTIRILAESTCESLDGGNRILSFIRTEVKIEEYDKGVFRNAKTRADLEY